ncbi:hypothetical protein [Peribacillus sp. SCS-155]|uniref:hypothetical protein n=1 Tax=Peribacillus sedimenti TaxID=3115297 RepID=UPI003905D14D
MENSEEDPGLYRYFFLWGDKQLFSAFVLPVIIIFGSIAAIAAWIHTLIILRELHEIKSFLGIIEVKKASFLDRDLDND